MSNGVKDRRGQGEAIYIVMPFKRQRQANIAMPANTAMPENTAMPVNCVPNQL